MDLASKALDSGERAFLLTYFSKALEPGQRPPVPQTRDFASEMSSQGPRLISHGCHRSVLHKPWFARVPVFMPLRNWSLALIFHAKFQTPQSGTRARTATAGKQSCSLLEHVRDS